MLCRAEIWTRQCTYDVIVRRVRATNVTVEKQYVLHNLSVCLYPYVSSSTAYSVCVFVALGIQRAMRMGSIILSSVASPILPYFYTLSHKRHDLRKETLFNMELHFHFLYNFV